MTSFQKYFVHVDLLDTVDILKQVLPQSSRKQMIAVYILEQFSEY